MSTRMPTGLHIQRSPRYTATLGVLLLSLVTGITVSLLQPSPEVNAITPPDTCFAFTAGTGTITNYYNNESNNPANPACPKAVDIPATIGGVSVTGITGSGGTNGAFKLKSLTAVTIPNSVTSIGDYAFYGNQLTNVTIPNSVTSIGVSALSANRLTSLAIPSSVTSIGGFAFYGNQLTSIAIPSSVTSIGGGAFSNNQLTSLSISNSVTSIGGFAFSDNKLTHPVILGTPTGPSIFQRNPLESISYGGTVYPILASSTTPTLPPDVCFSFNAATGRVASYDLYGLTALNQGVTCKDRNIIVPETIGGVTIVSASLYRSDLTGLSLPDTITGEVDVSYNYLTSLRLPNSLTEMTSYMYNYNSLSRLSIPSGVTSIEPDALFGQNPWGDDLENGSRPEMYIYSNNPAAVQRAYDSIWYVRAYTADPSNPHSLSDWAVSEDWDIGDRNKNGVYTDSLGGHLINPASTVVKYQDTQGKTIAPDVTVTGLKTGKTPSSALDSSDYLHSYLVTESAIPAPLDPYSPTPEELTIMQEGFSQYYRMGQSVEFQPKAIAGYVTPTTQTVTLSEEDNVVTFTYTPAITSVPFATNAVTNGSLTNTTPPAGTHVPLIASSRLAISSEGDCSTIESASLLSPSETGTLPSGVSALGGVAFTLACSSAGSTGIDYTLGAVVQDTSKLRVFKYSTVTKELVDITNQVTFSTTVIDGEARTVIHYNLTDGGELDEDGVVNGIITDPIVIGYTGDVGELASTGVNMWVMVGGGVLLLAAGTGVILQRVRRG